MQQQILFFFFLYSRKTFGTLLDNTLQDQKTLKRVYEGLKGFWGTTKKCENENLTQFLFQYSFQKWSGL